MKELTIQEKAKAYDKAIKVIKDNLGALNEIVETGAEVVNIQSIQNCFYKAFPELKESNDERIRKEIIDYVNKATGCKRWVAWLEKQGKQEEPQVYGTKDGEVITYSENDGYKGVEPKFKVGDWCIDNEDGTIFQIVKVLDKTYRYRTNEGKEYSCTHYSLELDARLWNIQDAKDGDVLTAHECLVLFREIDGLNIRCYCTYHFMNNPSFYVYTLQNKDAFQPATKEQRNQLEKSMADAGYAFDFDKKELKKIENEEYDGDDYGIDSLWHARHILKKTLGKVDGYQSDDGILEHKCAISAVDRLYKHSIAWSEEDEHWMQKVIDFMNHPDLIKATPTLAKDTINWLKSLKDRVGNFDDGYKVGFSAAKHNQWKPSDEQVEVLSIYAHVHDVLASLYHDLKKLKG